MRTTFLSNQSDKLNWFFRNVKFFLHKIASCSLVVTIFQSNRDHFYFEKAPSGQWNGFSIQSKLFFYQRSSSWLSRRTLNDLYDTTFMTHGWFSNFHLRLHYHTSCSYRVHKSCSCKVFSLQEFKQNASRTNCSSSN